MDHPDDEKTSAAAPDNLPALVPGRLNPRGNQVRCLWFFEETPQQPTLRSIVNFALRCPRYVLAMQDKMSRAGGAPSSLTSRASWLKTDVPGRSSSSAKVCTSTHVGL